MTEDQATQLRKDVANASKSARDRETINRHVANYHDQRIDAEELGRMLTRVGAPALREALIARIVSPMEAAAEPAEV